MSIAYVKYKLSTSVLPPVFYNLVRLEPDPKNWKEVKQIMITLRFRENALKNARFFLQLVKAASFKHSDGIINDRKKWRSNNDNSYAHFF